MALSEAMSVQYSMKAPKDDAEIPEERFLVSALKECKICETDSEKINCQHSLKRSNSLVVGEVRKTASTEKFSKTRNSKYPQLPQIDEQGSFSTARADSPSQLLEHSKHLTSSGKSLRKRSLSWSPNLVCECGRKWTKTGVLISSQPDLNEDIEDIEKPDENLLDKELVAELREAVPRVNLYLRDEKETVTLPRTLCKICKSATCLSVKPTCGYYTEAQIETHNRPDDCWISANGNIYDVTRYIGKHPGGSRSIVNLAGQDASRHFEFHTPYTRNKIWSRYKIGRVAYCNASERAENCTVC